MDKGICSYALKTTAIHLRESKPKENWKEENLPELFVMALELLADFVNPKKK